VDFQDAWFHTVRPPSENTGSFDQIVTNWEQCQQGLQLQRLQCLQDGASKNRPCNVLKRAAQTAGVSRPEARGREQRELTATVVFLEDGRQAPNDPGVAQTGLRS